MARSRAAHRSASAAVTASPFITRPTDRIRAGLWVSPTVSFTPARSRSTATCASLLAYTLLAGGQSALIVKNLAAFSSRYNTNGLVILGEYSGDLNNAGGHLVLRGNVNEPILDFSYADNWYPTTDGFGFSLVAVNDNAPAANWGLATNWRPSSASGGSPGVTDPAPPSRPGILINEALTHTDPDADIIELYNPTASAPN